MQIWRNPNSFIAAKGSLGGWLAVVARNRSIDSLRRKRPSESVEEIALASPYNLAEEAERNNMMERARAAIQQLPGEQRKTLEMAFFDGLSHSEIAEVTGEGYRIRRMSDGSVLGELFSRDDVRRERSRQGFWWH